MIQRRQTVYMFLSAVICALLFFMPLAIISEAPSVRFTVLGWNTITESNSYVWPLVALTIVMTALPLITIFLYKKRTLQVKLCRLEMLLSIIFIGLVYLVYDKDDINAVQAVGYEAETITLACYYGMIIPLVNIILELLAVRGVKKDIELLKSIDRLR